MFEKYHIFLFFEVIEIPVSQIAKVRWMSGPVESQIVKTPLGQASEEADKAVYKVHTCAYFGVYKKEI